MAERAADGHSASGLRGLASAVRAAEDLALVPWVVAALHWRIAKSGRGPGPQAYVSPRALVHIWNAATAPDDRVVAALARIQCGSGLGRPPPSGAMTSTARSEAVPRTYGPWPGGL